jgi:hypothetical protein
MLDFKNTDFRGSTAVQINEAIGSFFVEFSKLETRSVGMALRSLSRDALFVEHAEQLLDLDARLKLLERMAFVRGVPAALMAELEGCLLLARGLSEHREEVARNLASPDSKGARAAVGAGNTGMLRRRNADLSRLAELETLFMPDVGRIQGYTREAIALQATLNALTGKLERHLTAVAEQA